MEEIRTRAQKLKRFDEVARQWKTTPPEGNEALRENLRNELFVLGFDLFDDKSNGFLDTFISFFAEKFDPDRQDASHYFNFVMSRRRHEDENVIKKAESLEENAGGSENDKGSKYSNAERKLNKRSLEEGSDTVADDIYFDDTLVTLTALILTMHTRLKGKENNEKRRNYFRMFFTDGIVYALQSTYELPKYERRERELFEAMHIRFMDFFLTARCRTVAEVSVCGTKRHGEMVDGADMGEVGHPLPNDVYRAYFKKMENTEINSDGSISNQRDAYEKFLRSNLF